jgi:hypothetical protein
MTFPVPASVSAATASHCDAVHIGASGPGREAAFQRAFSRICVFVSVITRRLRSCW